MRVEDPSVSFLHAARPWHLPVDDKGVECVICKRRLHFFNTVGGGHLSSRAGQHITLKLQHSLFVFDKENSSFQRSFAAGRFRLGFRDRGPARGRQFNFNDRATVIAVVGRYFPVVLLDDSVTNTQTEAGSLADVFCGVERLKNTMRLLNTRPGIMALARGNGDLALHPPPRPPRS
jgi:hypothetical protein